MRAVAVVFVCSAMFLGAAVVDAVAASCHGSPATIVGTSGSDRLVGTTSNDVIAARGATTRSSLAAAGTRFVRDEATTSSEQSVGSTCPAAEQETM
jgi:hypothetical protein